MRMTAAPDPLTGNKRAHLTNCILLATVVLLSSLPYLGGLGFYSDDWDTLAGFTHLGPRAEVASLLAPDSDMRLRPLQVAYLAVTVSSFGLHRLPYHLVAALLLAAATLSVYAAAVQLLRSHWLGLAVALVFALLPQYSTDRFWISSQQAVLAMIFAVLGICALLRAMDPGQRRAGLWSGCTIVCFALSLLAYEVAIGLIGAAVLYAAIDWYRSRKARDGRTSMPLVGLGGAVLAIAFVCLYKILLQHRLTMRHEFLHHLGERFWNAAEMFFQFNFGTYLLHMPRVLLQLWRDAALGAAAFAAAAIIAAGVFFSLGRSIAPDSLPTRKRWTAMLSAGLALYLLGFALFFAAPGTPFASAGLTNRVTIAAAIGAALVEVALAGLAASLLRRPLGQARAFSLLIGLACGANCLAVNGIAHYWVDAAHQQQRILQSAARDLHGLPGNSSLLLDGACSYSGPAPIFETGWDATGAMQLALGDPSLSAGVLAHNAAFADTEVVLTLYDQVVERYPYAANLFVYDAQRHTITALPTHAAALHYLELRHTDGKTACPASREGDGARIF